MKRLNAVVAAIATAMALFSFGCDNPKKDEPVEQPPPPAAERFNTGQIPEPEHAGPTQPPVSATPAPTTIDEPVATIAEHPAPVAPKASTKAKPKQSYAPATTKGGKTYVVKSGDTLQEISQKFYGTTKKWRKIYDANKSKVKDPNKLQVGTKLTIPQ